MTKVRTRRLWLKVLFDVPKEIPRSEIIKRLIKGIDDGSYRVPRGWRVVIEWRNKEYTEPHRGEWSAELKASRDNPSWGSNGFENAVRSYLEKQL